MIKHAQPTQDGREPLKFIDDTLKLIESSQPPAYGSDCQWCDYLKKFK
jgi:hypothetical protein